MKNSRPVEIHFTPAGVERVRVWGRNIQEHLAGVRLYEKIAKHVTEIDSLLRSERREKNERAEQ